MNYKETDRVELIAPPLKLDHIVAPLVNCMVRDCYYRLGMDCINARIEIDKLGMCCSFRLSKVIKKD